MRIFKRLYLYQCEKKEKYFLISQCNASKILLFWLSVERKKVPLKYIYKIILYIISPSIIPHRENLTPRSKTLHIYIHSMKVTIISWYFWSFVDINVYVATAHPDSEEMILNVICFHFLSKTDSRRRRPDPSFI